MSKMYKKYTMQFQIVPPQHSDLRVISLSAEKEYVWVSTSQFVHMHWHVWHANGHLRQRGRWPERTENTNNPPLSLFLTHTHTHTQTYNYNINVWQRQKEPKTSLQLESTDSSERREEVKETYKEKWERKERLNEREKPTTTNPLIQS